MNKWNVSRVWIAASALLAATETHAQWTGQLLNNLAVTNAFGQMIVLHDGGGGYGGSDRTAERAFDGNTDTFYDASESFSQGAWVGFKMEAPMLITRVRYYGRGGYVHRLRGTLIQGANEPDFSDAVTLWTLMPPADWNGNSWRDEQILSPLTVQPFMFVRFYCPLPESYGGSIGEIQFYGAEPSGEEPVPDAPVLAFDACINWYENMLWTNIPTNVILYEIQRKIETEPHFSPLTCVYAVAGEQHFLDASLMVYRDTTYRIRAVNCAGESPWVYAAAIARNSARGQWIGLPGSWEDNPIYAGDKVFDGNIATCYNSPGNIPNGAWTGLDFGAAREMTLLRYVPRRNLADRMKNGWFEVANDPDFTSPTTIHTVPDMPPPINAVTEVPMPPPVTARYARYCGPDASYGNAAEIEFVLADQPPLPPNGLTVTASDITNMYAVLSWRLNDVGSLISSVLVHRATSPGGPYVCVTPEGLDTPQQEWTDTDLIPGVTYFYRLTSLWVPAAGPPLESEPGPHVSYLPYARLERDWSDNTQLKTGMTILGLHYPPYDSNYLMEFLFDGDTGTSPDTSRTESNPALGVDLGKPHCIQFMRFVARENQLGRLNGAELRGSNDPDYTNNFTRLATFANSANFQFITIPTVTWEPFRYIFVQRPDEYVFNGNIAELELYGWDPAPLAGLFRAPPHVDLSIQTGGVRLDWEPDSAQDFYRIQRSADGISWTDVGTTDTPPFTDGSVTAGQHVFYRIVAVRGTPPNEEIATSAVYPITAYFLGGGTGLTATYFTNYFLAYDPAEAWAGTFTEGPLDWGNINTVRPEIPGSADNFRIVWTGKLIVPFESDYTFYATCDDGFVLRIDDTFVLNRWYYTSATEQETVHLTAGEHPLRLDYFQAGGGKGMKLEWGGPVERAVIPTSQLLPDPLPPNEDVFTQTGDWLGRTFGGNRLGYHTLNPDGSITLGFADGDIFSTAEQYHYVWQTIRGDFIFEVKADMDIDPLRPLAKAVLMVRNDLSGGSPLLAFCHAPQNAQCIVDRLVPGAEIDFQIPWTGEPPGNPLHLRIKRVKDVFTCAYRAPGSATWVEYPAFKDSGGVFERELYIGMAITSVLGNSPKMLQDVTFSEMTFTRLNGTMLMIR